MQNTKKPFQPLFFKINEWNLAWNVKKTPQPNDNKKTQIKTDWFIEIILLKFSCSFSAPL